MPEEVKKEDSDMKDENGLDQRVAALEQKLELILERLPDPEADKADECAEDANKADEEAEDEKDVKKELMEDEKLPQSPTGETDESAKPESDKVQVVEKSDLKKGFEDLKKALKEDNKKQFEELLKSHGFQKVDTPRAEAENLNKSKKKSEPDAYELLQKGYKTGESVSEKVSHDTGFSRMVAINKFLREGEDEEAEASQ